MTEPGTARKTTRRTPRPEALLAAACDIVAAGGLPALTLRPLAQKLDVSVTVLTTHFGDRAGVIAAICDAAGASDAALFDGWRTTLASLGDMAFPLAAGLAADLAEALLEEQATQQRALSMLYLEMLHACASDASIRPAFAGWSRLRQAFWDDFGRQAGIPAPMVACGWWHGYAIAEQCYGLALEGSLPYRMLRRLCLQRLFAGVAAPRPDAADAALFDRMGERMRHAGEPVADGPERAPPWLALAARACGMRLAAEGVGGLTHRAIAADVGIAHTTLSYRFPTQHHLVLAGLESITAHILGAVDAETLDGVQRLRSEGDGEKLDLARANCAVALAATRMPGLVPQVAHMRSRRGINLVKVFKKHMPDAHGIDALGAQVISLGLTGLINSLPPGEACDRAVGGAFAAAARWLQAGR